MRLLVVLEPGEASVEDALAPLHWSLERCAEGRVELTVILVGHTDGPEAGSAESTARTLLRGAGRPEDVTRLPGPPDKEVLRLLGRETFDEVAVSGGARTPAGKIRPSRLAERLLINAPVTLTLVR